MARITYSFVLISAPQIQIQFLKNPD